MPLKPINLKQRASRLKEIDPRGAFYFARNTLRGRWPEAEPYILKDLGYSIMYAMDVIKGRWSMAEPIILKDLGYANQYAYYVIKNRWPELEEIYKKHPNSKSYKSYVDDMKLLKKRVDLT